MLIWKELFGFKNFVDMVVFKWMRCMIDVCISIIIKF